MASKSHISSYLPIEDVAIPVDDDAHYFPFDHHLASTKLLYPEGWDNHTVTDYGLYTGTNLCATLRKGEGMFGGATAIEESTTNLVPDANLTNYSGNGSWVPVDDAGCIDGKGLRISNGAKSGYYFVDSLPVIAGETYTLTTRHFISSDYDTSERTSFCLHSNGTHYNLFGTKKGEWEIKSYTFTISADGTMKCGLYNSDTFTNGYILVDWIQLEKKPFNTSFVDGNRQAGKLNFDTNLIFVSEGTISCWLYMPNGGLTGNNGGRRRIISNSQASTTPGHFSLHGNKDTSNILFQINDDNGNSKTISASNLTQGEWHLITCKWSNENMSLYIDGELRAQATDHTLPTKHPDYGRISVGYVETYGDELNSLIDDLMIAKRPLSDPEIMSIYESQRPLYDPNFLAHIVA